MKNNFLRGIITFPIFTILLISFLILMVGVNNINLIRENLSLFVTNNFIEHNKSLSYERVKNIKDTIFYEEKELEHNLTHELTQKMEIALKLVESTYQKNIKTLSNEEIRELVIKELSYLRFDDEEGYFYIFDLENNILLGHPIKSLIGKDFTLNNEFKAKDFLFTLKDILKKEKFAFTKFIFFKPNDTTNKYLKLNGAFKFKSLNLIIGTGAYLDAYEDKYKRLNIKKIEKLNEKWENKVIFYQLDNDIKNLVNKNFVNENLKSILLKVKSEGEGSFDYITDDGRKKHSYFYFIKDWNWVIESGFYYDKLNPILSKINDQLVELNQNTLKKSLIIVAVILIFTLIVSMLILNRMKDAISKYTDEIENKSKELETIFDTTKDGIKIIDFEGETLYFNRAYLKLLGYSKDEIVKNDSINLSKTILAKVKERGSLRDYEEVFYKKNGKQIYLNMSIALMPDKKRYLITIRDVTRQKKDEEKIQKYIDLIDKNIIVSTTDLDGIITYASDAFCKISGYTKDELLGKKHTIVKHEDTPEKIYKQIRADLEKNGVWEGELKNKRKDGTTYWVKVIINLIFEEDKKIGYTAIREDITDKKIIEKLAQTDKLTQLYNRVKIDKELDVQIYSAQRYNTDFSLILLDIDKFKSINDNYGHQIGDVILQELALILKRKSRKTDIVGRWGGEEFLIICTQTKKDEAVVFAESLRKEIENFSFKTVGKVTSSFGVSSYENGDDIKSIVYKCDMALYRSKEDGRNRVTLFKE